MTKLVRDHIPEIIHAKGESASFRVAEPMEYRRALADKLVEEAEEFRVDRNVEELADVLEVVRTIAAEHGIALDQVIAMADRKREERGGFDSRLLLVDP